MGEPRTPREMDADFEEVGEERFGDRRSSARRAAKRRFDTLFAITLINQVTAPEAPSPRSYEAPRQRARAGKLVNLRA